MLSSGSVLEWPIAGISAIVVGVAVVAIDFSSVFLFRIGEEILSSCCPAAETKCLLSYEPLGDAIAPRLKLRMTG
eukprot:scaffold19556_cov73-Skeletonema_marinoi.AAC.1